MSAPRYSKDVKEVLRTLQSNGWEVLGRGRGGHYRLRHPLSPQLMVMSATSSDRSFQKQVLRQAARLLEGGLTIK